MTSSYSKISYKNIFLIQFATKNRLIVVVSKQKMILRVVSTGNSDTIVLILYTFNRFELVYTILSIHKGGNYFGTVF